MIDRGGTGLTQLTNSPTDEIAPCWSPDGSRIAFTVWGNRSHQWEIWTLAVDQPGVRHFLVNGMFPAWSPDGGRIAFQRARKRGSRLFGIWTVDLQGNEARHPTEIAHSESQACIAPCWSPDGTMLVYCAVRRGTPAAAVSRDTPAEADLWVAETETGLRIKLTDGADASFNPVWARSGRIFFVSPRTGTENIWSLTTELGEYAVAAPDTSRMTRAGDDVSSEVADD